jgi:hypothetical protein
VLSHVQRCPVQPHLQRNVGIISGWACSQQRRAAPNCDRKGVNAQKPDRGSGVHRNNYPHAVHGGKLHGYVEVLNPERGSLERDSNDLSDAIRLGTHPDVAKQQSLFLALGNDVQHVLWNNAKVLLAQEDEVIIGSADVSLVTFFGRNNLLLQNGAYDLLTSGATLRIGDCECFCVRRRKTDLGRDSRNRVWVVGMKFSIFSSHFVRDETQLGFARRFAPRNPESSSDLPGQLVLPVRVMNKESPTPSPPEKEAPYSIGSPPSNGLRARTL